MPVKSSINKISFIITPVGDLSSSHWQTTMKGPDGHKIVCIALMLRDLSVESNAGGLICHPSGTPLTLHELAAVLSVDTSWLDPVLRGPLSRIGVMIETDEGGWVCNDPVAVNHFKRLHNVPGTQSCPPKLILESAPQGETPEEKQRRQGRNRKKKWDYKKKWEVEPQCYYDNEQVTSLDNSVDSIDPVKNGSVTEIVTRALPGHYQNHVTQLETNAAISSCCSALPNIKESIGLKESSPPSINGEDDDFSKFLNPDTIKAKEQKLEKIIQWLHLKEDLPENLLRENAKNMVSRTDITHPLEYLRKVVNKALIEQAAVSARGIDSTANIMRQQQENQILANDEAMIAAWGGLSEDEKDEIINNIDKDSMAYYLYNECSEKLLIIQTWWDTLNIDPQRQYVEQHGNVPV